MSSTSSISVVIADDEPDALSLLRRYVSSRTGLIAVAEARSGREAVRAVDEHAPRLLLLDVEMPELDGFGVLEELQRRGSVLPAVIFITAYDRYAVRAFEAHAIDYLLKPVSKERFDSAVDRFLASRRSSSLDVPRLLEDALQRPPKRLLIRRRGRIVPVPVDSIEWVEAEGDYVNIHLQGRSYLVERTLSRMEDLLKARSFMRIHRSTLVNLQQIRELQPLGSGRYILVLKSGHQLNVSRTYGHLFKVDVL